MTASIGSLYIVKTVGRGDGGRDRLYQRAAPAMAAEAATTGIGRVRTAVDTVAR